MAKERIARVEKQKKNLDAFVHRMRRERSLSAVSWVGNTWFAAVVIGVILISVISFLMQQKEDEKVVYVLIAVLLFVTALLTLPYIHYRIEHGYIKRIPPRFHLEKAYFTKTIEKVI
jgi:hypothetical protein